MIAEIEEKLAAKASFVKLLRNRQAEAWRKIKCVYPFCEIKKSTKK